MAAYNAPLNNKTLTLDVTVHPTGLLASDVSITVNESLSGFPATGYLNFDRASATSREFMYWTAVNTGTKTFTVTRGADTANGGTAATTHGTTATIVVSGNGGYFSDLLTGAATFTNKTLTSPTINGGVISGAFTGVAPSFSGSTFTFGTNAVFTSTGNLQINGTAKIIFANTAALVLGGGNGIVRANLGSDCTFLTAPSGTIVGTSDSQTLTNKTVSGTTFSSLAANGSNYAFIEQRSLSALSNNLSFAALATLSGSVGTYQGFFYEPTVSAAFTLASAWVVSSAIVNNSGGTITDYEIFHEDSSAIGTVTNAYFLAVGTASPLLSNSTAHTTAVNELKVSINGTTRYIQLMS